MRLAGDRLRKGKAMKEVRDPMEKKEQAQKKEQAEKKERKGFGCPACGAEFTTLEQLDNHKKEHQKTP